jgi:hypothetical protein
VKKAKNAIRGSPKSPRPKTEAKAKAKAKPKPQKAKAKTEAQKAKARDNLRKNVVGGRKSEREAAEEIGGISQKHFEVEGTGGRYVDQFKPDKGAAYEVKTGYTPFSKRVREQAEKDAYLLEKGDFDYAEWWFYRSETTGKRGPSKSLEEFLENNNIKVTLKD